MGSMPRALSAGDLVRVVAPSGCFDRESFAVGLSFIERAGFRPSYDEAVLTRRMYLAGDDERRLGELEAALGDPRARAVWIARGGYGATRLLGRLDPEKVSAHRPWLVGFSDATALHALWARAGVVSVHGANVTTLAQWSEAARAELFGLLSAPRPVVYQGATLRRGSRASGPLRGGNLTVLASMAGTGALPSFAGAVLLLEDVGERPYRLDRAVTQLRQAGALDGVRAVVVGQLTDCEEPRAGFGPLDAVMEALAGLDLPVLTGFPLGHEPSARPVLLEATAEVDPERGTVTVRP